MSLPIITTTFLTKILCTIVLLSYLTTPIARAQTQTVTIKAWRSGTVCSLDCSVDVDYEAQALSGSGWWSGYCNDTSQRCNWTGITCNEAGSITKIQPLSDVIKVGDKFKHMNFCAFTNLVSLSLSGHGLTWKTDDPTYNTTDEDKSSESFTCNLPFTLKHLDLSNNYLYGELSPCFGAFTQLEFLDLSYNHVIQGSIPPEFGKLKNLAVLNLTGNKLESFPPSFFLLTNLTHLHMSSNQLNNFIPKELGNLEGIMALNLSSCGLIGLIPSSFGQLTNLIS